MNPPPVPPPAAPPPIPKSSGSLRLVLIVVAVSFGGLIAISLLAALVLPMMSGALERGRATQIMNNARQIQLAAARMSLDFDVAADPALGWPGDLARSNQRPVTTLAGYVERLVEYQYFNRQDLPQLFQAPGIPPYTGAVPFDVACSPFKIYRVQSADAAGTLFLATRNFTFGTGLDAQARPFGSKLGIVCLKDGSCSLVSPEQARRTDFARMSGHPSPTDPARETPASTLKM